MTAFLTKKMTGAVSAVLIIELTFPLLFLAGWVSPALFPHVFCNRFFCFRMDDFYGFPAYRTWKRYKIFFLSFVVTIIVSFVVGFLSV